MCSMSVELWGGNVELLTPPGKPCDNSDVYGVFVFHGCVGAFSTWFVHKVVQADNE